jgi:inorganic pyrophosphatase
MVIDVLIEIPANSSVKYEFDENLKRLYVDRFQTAPMNYPENYGLIEGTKGGDGDPLDAFVLTSQPIVPGSWIKVRPIAMVVMEDEKGSDNKLLCVPVDEKVDPITGNWQTLSDIQKYRLDRIIHFLQHYKDLESGKWVKINHVADKNEAEAELAKSKVI